MPIPEGTAACSGSGRTALGRETAAVVSFPGVVRDPSSNNYCAFYGLASGVASPHLSLAFITYRLSLIIYRLPSPRRLLSRSRLPPGRPSHVAGSPSRRRSRRGLARANDHTSSHVTDSPSRSRSQRGLARANDHTPSHVTDSPSRRRSPRGPARANDRTPRVLDIYFTVSLDSIPVGRLNASLLTSSAR